MRGNRGDGGQARQVQYWCPHRAHRRSPHCEAGEVDEEQRGPRWGRHCNRVQAVFRHFIEFSRFFPQELLLDLQLGWMGEEVIVGGNVFVLGPGCRAHLVAHLVCCLAFLGCAVCSLSEPKRAPMVTPVGRLDTGYAIQGPMHTTPRCIDNGADFGFILIRPRSSPGR